MAQRLSRKKSPPNTARLGGVDISSPERMVWAEEGISKLELARYYESMAEYLLRFLDKRPMVLRPFPRGARGPSFWLQDAPKGVPEFVPTWRRIPPATGRAIDMVVGGDLRSLLWLVQYNVIEMHAWLARLDAPEQPDFAVLELDAHSGAPFELVARAARLAHACLEELDLRGFPKLSGGSGIHVLVPLAREYSFDQVRAFVKRLGQRIAEREPNTLSTELSTARERRCVYLDYPQNGAGKNLVAPYSARARPDAPVSAPITWEELDDAELRANRWSIREMPARLESVGDLMEPAYGLAQQLPLDE